MHASTSEHVVSADPAPGDPVLGDNVLGQMERLRREHPQLHALVDLDRLQAWHAGAGDAIQQQDDFGADTSGGRGIEYLEAQALNSHARAVGIRKLLSLVSDAAQPGAGGRVLVDLLGGDGLVGKVCAKLGIDGFNIITCDASPYMVSAAWAGGMPALLQRAEQPLFKDRSVDAVLLAYGSHHLPPSDRQTVASEAYRILRPGGTFVLHDFPVGSPVDVWFERIVDRYSLTGHRFLHFTRAEIEGYLEKANYDEYAVVEIDDPYTATGATPDEATVEIGRYLLKMYGLVKLLDDWDEAEACRWVAETAWSIFRYPEAPDGPEGGTQYREDLGAWQVTIPRRALVGVGHRKPAAP